MVGSTFPPTSEPTANKEPCTSETQSFKSLEEVAGPRGYMQGFAGSMMQASAIHVVSISFTCHPSTKKLMKLQHCKHVEYNTCAVRGVCCDVVTTIATGKRHLHNILLGKNQADS